jgi:SAM-dependent methyltransferase
MHGIPILLNEYVSIFRIADYVEGAPYPGASGYAGSTDPVTGFRRTYRQMARVLTEHSVKRNQTGPADVIRRVRRERPHARILVIGTGDSYYGDDITYTDIAFGRNVTCICDAQDLPFPAGAFDAVLAVAVLEHVCDPYRCVEEIRRVLSAQGYVYADTPFLQSVHMAAYDFTRFTYLGHRRLFRWFDDIDSGIAGGPGMVAAYVFQYLILSFSDNRVYRRVARLLGLILGVPIKYVDYICRSRRSAYDVAAGNYFFGRKRDEPISDRDMIALYRGGG